MLQPIISSSPRSNRHVNTTSNKFKGKPLVNDPSTIIRHHETLAHCVYSYIQPYNETSFHERTSQPSRHLHNQFSNGSTADNIQVSLLHPLDCEGILFEDVNIDLSL